MLKLFAFLKRKKPEEISNKDVDLSKDGVFDRKIRGISLLENLPDYKETGLVHTGDVSAIAQKTLCDGFCDGKTCDCCGKPLSPFAFDTLCSECSERIVGNSVHDMLFDADKEKRAKLEKVWFVEQTF